MVSITNILDVNTLEKALDLLKKWGYQIKNTQERYIAKTSAAVTVHRVKDLDLKGLIFDMAGTVVAPGLPVSLEDRKPGGVVAFYTKALDGIMFRFYKHDGVVCVSTSGSVIPTYWGAPGSATFEQLLSDAEDQWNTEIHPDWCYSAILEHVDFCNVVRAADVKLTLVDIVDIKTLRHVALEADTCFKNHAERLNSEPSLTQDTVARPVSSDDVGYTLHYADGTVKRIESNLYKRAHAIKPNLPDPRQHWVNLYKEGSVAVYLQFYPWHSDLFLSLTKRYHSLVCTIAYDFQQILESGWENSKISPRNIKFMNELLLSNIKDDASLDDIASYLLQEDAQRIYYMMDLNNDYHSMLLMSPL